MIKKISYQEGLSKKYPETNDISDVLRVEYIRIKNTIAYQLLYHKLQVFPFYNCLGSCTTRGLHTEYVRYIAKQIARSIPGINILLVKILATTHDMGHFPFGHTAEEVIQRYLLDKHQIVFHGHDEQVIHVLTELETVSQKFNGINPTKVLLDNLTARCKKAQIKNKFNRSEKHTLLNDQLKIIKPLEAYIIDIADGIAYLIHDIIDCLRSGDIEIKQLSNMPCFKGKLWNDIDTTCNCNSNINFLIKVIREKLEEYFIESIIKNCRSQKLELNKDYLYYTNEDFINFNADVLEQFNLLKRYMYQHIYDGAPCKKRDIKILGYIGYIIQILENFDQYQQQYNFFQLNLERFNQPIRIKDIIWSMSDNAAVTIFNRNDF